MHKNYVPNVNLNDKKGLFYTIYKHKFKEINKKRFIFYKRMSVKSMIVSSEFFVFYFLFLHVRQGRMNTRL